MQGGQKVGWDQTVKGYISLQVKGFYFILVTVSQQHLLGKDVTWSNVNIRTINSCHNVEDGLAGKK